MIRRRDRIIALIIAVAFFGTSFALSFLVIWQLVQDNKEAKTVQQITDNSGADNNSQAEAQKPLQGTQLEGFTPVENIGKLERIELKPGTGEEVKPGAKVTVDYTGAIASTGTIFQSSLDFGEPISFPLDGVLKGWTEGIPGAKVGGTYRLLIPSDQAYGAAGNDGIPPNADLVFDITIHAAE